MAYCIFLFTHYNRKRTEFCAVSNRNFIFRNISTLNMKNRSRNSSTAYVHKSISSFTLSHDFYLSFTVGKKKNISFLIKMVHFFNKLTSLMISLLIPILRLIY